MLSDKVGLKQGPVFTMVHGHQIFHVGGLLWPPKFYPDTQAFANTMFQFHKHLNFSVPFSSALNWTVLIADWLLISRGYWTMGLLSGHMTPPAGLSSWPSSPQLLFWRVNLMFRSAYGSYYVYGSTVSHTGQEHSLRLVYRLNPRHLGIQQQLFPTQENG